MFLCYYVAWPCDLDLWPFDLESVSRQCFSCPNHIPIFIILRQSVTELRFLNIWSYFRYLKQSLRMRRVTWPISGGKNSPHFWNLWPRFAYSLCHFQDAKTKIKQCYMRKIAFIPLCIGYKVQCAWAVSRYLCIGAPPKPHVTIFWPRIDYSLYNFYGATMTIKGVTIFWPRIDYSLYNFYGATMTIKGSFILEHPHFKAVLAAKKLTSSQNWSQNGSFSGI